MQQYQPFQNNSQFNFFFVFTFLILAFSAEHQRNFSYDDFRQKPSQRYNQGPSQLMRRYLEKGNEINKMQAAGRPVLFPAQSLIMPSNIQQQQPYAPSIAISGKKRFAIPQNEIDQLSIFRPPNDEFRPDNREYAQYDYDRNLMTDDIDGAKSGTRTSPVLKNIVRAKELTEFNRKHPYSQFQSLHLLLLFKQIIPDFQQRPQQQYQQQYYQKPITNQENFQQQMPYSRQSMHQPASEPYYSQQMPFNSQNQNYQGMQQINQFANQPKTAQMKAGQHILFNGQLIMNDNLPNEYGFLGFERMGRKNNSIHKFGSGLKEMGLM